MLGVGEQVCVSVVWPAVDVCKALLHRCPFKETRTYCTFLIPALGCVSVCTCPINESRVSVI